jgi:hypothetical protein
LKMFLVKTKMLIVFIYYDHNQTNKYIHSWKLKQYKVQVTLNKISSMNER